MSDHNPGDIVNGHILSSTGEWVPVQPAPAVDGTGATPVVPPAAPKKRTGLIVGAVVGVAVIAVVAVLAVRATQKPALDEAGQTACAKVAEVQAAPQADPLSEQGMATVSNIIAAIALAKKSTVPGLQAAAATESAASNLPPSDPGYRNPGDVQFEAVAAWCAANT